MTDLHTTKAFDTDLQDLARMVAEMGGLAEKQVADSVDALAKRDTALAQRVTAADANIDNLQREIEEKAVNTIARRQPMAVDLREIVGALRLANDLERIGDLAKNIAKRVIALNGEFPPPKLIRGVEHMTDLVLEPAEGGARCLRPARHQPRRWRCGAATRKSTRSAPRCSANCSPI